MKNPKQTANLRNRGMDACEQQKQQTTKIRKDNHLFSTQTTKTTQTTKNPKRSETP